MDIYVATAFGNRENARKMMSLLGKHGHRITHDWTREEATPGFLASQDIRNEYGYYDYVGVVDADAVVVLAHPDAKDTRCEMGIAIGMQKPVILVNPEAWCTVFGDARLGVYPVPDEANAIAKLASLEAEWFEKSVDLTDDYDPAEEWFKSEKDVS